MPRKHKFCSVYTGESTRTLKSPLQHSMRLFKITKVQKIILYYIRNEVKTELLKNHNMSSSSSSMLSTIQTPTSDTNVVAKYSHFSATTSCWTAFCAAAKNHFQNIQRSWWCVHANWLEAIHRVPPTPLNWI